ncbi:MAG: glycine cleavage system aminomethyltransferase GcvT [Bacilli bacterium]
MKKTALYDVHLALGAKMVEFAGWEMPIEYQGLTQEHFATRQTCGLFDVSHMGEIMITGDDALSFTNYLVSGGVKPVPMRMTYGMLLHHDGGVIDDLMVYFYNPQKILLVVNASNLEKDVAWIISIQKNSSYQVIISDISSEVGLIALQGKQASTILQYLTTYPLDTLKMFDFEDLALHTMPFMISRSGYTGEDGFEIYGKNDDIVILFQKLVNLGAIPCGLGCRDTLRFEASMPLYGHEMNETVNPFEAGLSFGVDMNKDDFIGKEALLRAKSQGLKRKIVALELVDRGIARADYPVYDGDHLIGHVTTGYLIPGHDKALALAILDVGYWDLGTLVQIQIRKNRVEAVVRNKKFLHKQYVK